MGMTYADNFYTNNTDKVFDMVCDGEGNFEEKDFDRQMELLKDEELNRLWEVIKKMEFKLEVAEKALKELGHYGIDFGYGEYTCNVAEIAQNALNKIKD